MSDFWAFNFWGLIGTLSGFAGLLISYFSFTYSKPHIRVKPVSLTYPKYFLDKPASSPEDLKTMFMYFKLVFDVSNVRGGAGSVEKPKLLVKHKQTGEIVFTGEPKTDEVKHIKNNSGMIINSEINSLGKAYYLQGGEKLPNEELQYNVYGKEILYNLHKNKLEFKFYMAFKNNLGKYFEKEVKNIEAVVNEF